MRSSILSVGALLPRLEAAAGDRIKVQCTPLTLTAEVNVFRASTAASGMAAWLRVLRIGEEDVALGDFGGAGCRSSGSGLGGGGRRRVLEVGFLRRDLGLFVDADARLFEYTVVCLVRLLLYVGPRDESFIVHGLIGLMYNCRSMKLP